jgi:hypothetical protein
MGYFSLPIDMLIKMTIIYFVFFLFYMIKVSRLKKSEIVLAFPNASIAASASLESIYTSF